MILTTDQRLDLLAEQLKRIEGMLAALSNVIAAIGVGTRTLPTDGAGAALLPETGGAINAPPVTQKRTSADAYWENQPAPVQMLRSMPVGDARTKLAYELVEAGHQIDKRIMVQGWDPLSSMKSWKDAGYTWIPALGQPDIPVSPGLTYFGKPSYDPANPPPGSIKVDTSFADGYEW